MTGSPITHWCGPPGSTQALPFRQDTRNAHNRPGAHRRDNESSSCYQLSKLKFHWGRPAAPCHPSTHRGARTHDHNVKNLALCRLS